MKVILVFVVALLAQGQEPRTIGTANTKGSCSPVNTGSITTFNYTCGIGQKQGAELLRIVNKILANQIDPEVVIAKLDEILLAVNPNATKGTYLLDGSRRSTSPGRDSLIVATLPEFLQIVELLKQEKWKELIRVADRAIKDYPGWYTPMYAAGLAYTRLGDKAKGSLLLKQAAAGMADNPDYEGLPEAAKRELATLGR